MPYIASTMSSTVHYHDYHKSLSGANHIKRTVTVKGGAGVAKGSNGGIHTPDGLLTKVTTDELEFLMQDDTFKQHLAGGFVSVLNHEAAPEKFVKDMVKRDGAAPLTDADYSEGGRFHGQKFDKLAMVS